MKIEQVILTCSGKKLDDLKLLKDDILACNQTILNTIKLFEELITFDKYEDVYE